MTALTPDERTRGVVAATTGNHGQGIAYGGGLLGVETIICVPARQQPGEERGDARTRRDGRRGRARLRRGRRRDAATRRAKGRVVAHSTNDPRIIAGAATMTLEILEQEPDLDALVIAVGGGSQAVGAITVARALAPTLEVYGVQAAGASAIHDSWHARKRLTATARRHVCRRRRDANDLRSDVSGAAGRARRLRHGDRCGDRRESAHDRLADAQPRRGRGRDGLRGAAEAARPTRGQARRRSCSAAGTSTAGRCAACSRGKYKIWHPELLLMSS